MWWEEEKGEGRVGERRTHTETEAKRERERGREREREVGREGREERERQILLCIVYVELRKFR